MNLKQTTLKDIPAIMSIISDAQSYLKDLGIDQWQDGYPNEEQILIDIKNEDSYVIANEENAVMGTVVFTTKIEPTYQNIEGDWITKGDSKYGVIHRLAVSDEFRGYGVAKYVFQFCEDELVKSKVQSMRIDTHRGNSGMQKLITSLGYKYCGVIILSSGAERLAFEKVLIH